MKKDTYKTDVVFRKFAEGDVIAIFPKEIENNKKECLSYMHLGQHSGASVELIKELKKATKKEYSDLKNELESIGYNLKIKN